jgi:hypothetical protein
VKKAAINETPLVDLVMSCAFAIIAGQKTVTVSATGKRPAGFPRGELLSVGTNGAMNYAIDPIKALAWIHSHRLKTHNVEVRGGRSAKRGGNLQAQLAGRPSRPPG